MIYVSLQTDVCLKVQLAISFRSKSSVSATNVLAIAVINTYQCLNDNLNLTSQNNPFSIAEGLLVRLNTVYLPLSNETKAQKKRINRFLFGGCTEPRLYLTLTYASTTGAQILIRPKHYYSY